MFEAAFGLAALVMFVLLVSPELRRWTQLVLALLVIVSVVTFVIWLAFRINEREPSASTFETSEFAPHPANARSGCQPPTLQKEERHAPGVRDNADVAANAPVSSGVAPTTKV